MKAEEQVIELLKHWTIQLKIHKELQNVTFNYGFIKALEWVLKDEQ